MFSANILKSKPSVNLSVKKITETWLYRENTHVTNCKNMPKKIQI